MSCVFCGSTSSLEKVVFPQTFTAYQLLQAGDQACKQCHAMFTDPKYRRNCWVTRKGNLEFIRDPLDFLLNLPEPPFLLYLTKGKRKHGWIRTVQNPVLSINRFVLSVDENTIYFDSKVYGELLGFCNGLFDRGVPKKVLLGGMPQPSIMRKYGLSWAEYYRLRELKGNQLWRVIVEFKRSN